METSALAPITSGSASSTLPVVPDRGVVSGRPDLRHRGAEGLKKLDHLR